MRSKRLINANEAMMRITNNRRDKHFETECNDIEIFQHTYDLGAVTGANKGAKRLMKANFSEMKLEKG